ncbi:hypothetical protein GCM10028794_02330 [Silanimonas algicola]
MRLAVRPALAVFAALALLMAATRAHHFGAIPDASWAVFFASGVYLAGHQRWAFPALMALAVVVDYLVISSTGVDFWSHYCVSPGYWFLLPAHAAMMGAGQWAASAGLTPRWALLGRLVLALAVGTAACHLLAQGGFYWFSSSVAEPTLGGWAKNYADWLMPYAQVAFAWTGMIAAVHVALQPLFTRLPATEAQTD